MRLQPDFGALLLKRSLALWHVALLRKASVGRCAPKHPEKEELAAWLERN